MTARVCVVCGGPSDTDECTGCVIADETDFKRKADV